MIFIFSNYDFFFSPVKYILLDLVLQILKLLFLVPDVAK
jgi:hypothetical protein